MINQMVESDIPIFADMTVASAVKLKKLLYVLAQSVPFKPNYTKLARFGYQPECVARLHELFGEGRSG